MFLIDNLENLVATIIREDGRGDLANKYIGFYMEEETYFSTKEVNYLSDLLEELINVDYTTEDAKMELTEQKERLWR